MENCSSHVFYTYFCKNFLTYLLGNISNCHVENFLDNIFITSRTFIKFYQTHKRQFTLLNSKQKNLSNEGSLHHFGSKNTDG